MEGLRRGKSKEKKEHLKERISFHVVLLGPYLHAYGGGSHKTAMLNRPGWYHDIAGRWMVC